MPNEPGLTPLGEFARQTFFVGTPPAMLFTEDNKRVDRDLIALSMQLRQIQATERLSAVMEAQQKAQLREVLIFLHPDQAQDFRELVEDRQEGAVTASLKIEAWELKSETRLEVWVSYIDVEAVFFLGEYWQLRKQTIRRLQEGGQNGE